LVEPKSLTIIWVTGKKLDQFPAEEEEALLLMERVTEAKRISHMVSVFEFVLLLFLGTGKLRALAEPNQLHH